MEQKNKMGIKPVFPLLMSMAFPPMLSMLIQSLYNIVDSMFVANYSKDALTAVSLAFPIQNLIISVAVGTGVGINSLIARRLGQKRYDEANNAVTHGILLALFAALLFIISGLLFIKPFFRLFASSNVIFDFGWQYTSIIVFCSFGPLVHIAIEKILQSTGNMVFPMIMQATGAILNIILDPILIFGLFGAPRLGVAGAAIATVIGQMTSMTLSLFFLFFKKHSIKPVIKGFQFHMDVAKQIYTVGFPTILMNSLGSGLIMGLNAILVSFSDTAVSVFGIYFKLQTFVYMPVSGLTQGALPIMAYNYGARDKKRLLDTLKYSIKVALFIMAIGTGLFLAFPTFLLLLFDATEEMLSIGIFTLKIICLGFLPAALGFLLATFFQSMGKGFYSLIIFLLRQFMITLPLAYILSKPMGLTGIWISFPISEYIAAIVSVYLFYIVYKKDALFQS